KNQIKLDQHGEVPPGRVEVHEIHRDIDEPEAKEAEDDATVYRFEAGDEWGNQVNEGSDPIHWIEAQKTGLVPTSPCNRPGGRPAGGRLHQGPATQNDKNSDRVEADLGYLQPGDSQAGQCASRQTAPVIGPETAVLEIGIEKMEVNDPTNRQRF